MTVPDWDSDEALVLQARSGSETHFNVLVDRYTPHVFRLALSITGDSFEAEEVVQETFLRAFQHLDRFSSARAGFKTWLLTIARNQSINVFRSLKRRAARFLGDFETEEHSFKQSESPMGEPHVNPEQLLGMKQEVAMVKQAISLLPERQRTALLLKSQEELSYEEIAAIMKTSVSSVESLIFRARKRLLETVKD